MLRLVNRLRPRVITTTTQARMYAVHALAWTEAAAPGYDLPQALDLVRRCELVVTGGASLCHDGHHRTRLAQPHGYDAIRQHIEHGVLPVAKASQPGKGKYAQYEWGFTGTYLGSDVQIELLRRVARRRPALAWTRMRCATASARCCAGRPRRGAGLRAQGCSVSLGPDGLITGEVGGDLPLERAPEAARFCALHVLVRCAPSSEPCLRLPRLSGCSAWWTSHRASVTSPWHGHDAKPRRVRRHP